MREAHRRVYIYFLSPHSWVLIVDTNLVSKWHCTNDIKKIALFHVIYKVVKVFDNKAFTRVNVLGNPAYVRLEAGYRQCANMDHAVESYAQIWKNLQPVDIGSVL